jgi:aspartyl-tRNA(Asn)/glutamyl-tRNA(Gln) amidotransferase subunit B
MQEGSLRVDANINLHVNTPDGHVVATPIVEVKNMNSFRAVERAMTYEAQRQFEVWKETGQKLGDVPKQTRGWDDAANVTRGQRAKEESSDYRYFPDPDLVPVTVTPEEIEAVRSSLGELPADLRHRLELTYGIGPYDSDVLVNQGPALVDYYVEVARLCGDGKLASNWVQQDVLRTLKEREIDVAAYAIAPASLADLLTKVKAGELDTSRGREVLAAMLTGGKSAGEVMAELGIQSVDDGALVSMCQELVDANPKIVADVKAGKQQAAAALIGQAKKKNPNVNAARVREICLELIAKM